MDDEFPEAFSQTFRVRYDECGADGTLRASVHMRLVQEIAFGHSAALGFPLAWYEQHRTFWLVRRVHLVVHAPARYGDALDYTTRVLGARKVLARRLNTARRAGDGTPVATAVVDWILTREGIAPVRIPEEMARAFPAMQQPIAPIPLDEAAPPISAEASPLWIRAGDVDALGHANNAAYLDLFDDAVVRAGGQRVIEAHPRTYDLLYHAAAESGAALRDRAWSETGLWHYRLERPDGTLLLHGRLVGADLPLAGL
ncbi:MAG: thioesterase [Armatimonadota bacterium]|nr:thioesterase [Armatimonadota bacterium]MDR7518032.1 thioesterase [Armatimonadota bacterium]